jgi:hypothetical protein
MAKVKAQGNKQWLGRISEGKVERVAMSVAM